MENFWKGTFSQIAGTYSISVYQKLSMNSIHDKLIKIHVLRLLASLKWLRYHLRPKCGKENKKKLYKNMSAYILQE